MIRATIKTKQMKKAFVILAMILLSGFACSRSPEDDEEEIKPQSLAWNTFLGGESIDRAFSCAVDDNGNIYVLGNSDLTWGNPLNPYSRPASGDVFLAKLDADGNLLWHTFLGGDGDDQGRGIAVDESGNIYVSGKSNVSWGKPLRPFTADYSFDAFAARLDANGVLQWNTFLGAKNADSGEGITVDRSGNVFITGTSSYSWGTPLHPHSSNPSSPDDAFVAKLGASGNLQWNTFLGSGDGKGIAVDRNGDVCFTGSNSFSWGEPLIPFHGGWDIQVAKLDTNGARQWHTYLGGSFAEFASACAVDSSGNIYVSGYGYETQSDNESGLTDAFVAKVDAGGALQWQTFLGGDGYDVARGIAVFQDTNITVTGDSGATWGDPENPFIGSTYGWGDAFLASLNAQGGLQWNTFLGGTGMENGGGIDVDRFGNTIIAGWSNSSWGIPLRPFDYTQDAFVAKFTK